MATGKSIKIRELTECSLCLERFTRPKALPCQHCFCFDCLVCWVDGEKFVICPQCRERHAVPKAGIAGFPDPDIAGQGEERCADCSEQADIIKTCPHCQQRICADCLIAHVVINATDQEDEGRSSSAVTSKPSVVTSKQSAVTSKLSAVASELSALTSKPPAVTSKPSAATSKLGAHSLSPPGKIQAPSDVQTINQQNQLPRNVDYRAMRDGPVTVIGDSGEEENMLQGPLGCAYHVARREVYVADSWNHRVMVYDRDGSNGRVFYKDLEYSPRDVAVSTDGQFVYIAMTEVLIKTNMNGKLVKNIKTFSLGEWEFCTCVYCYREFTLVIEKRCVIMFNQADEEIRCFRQEHIILYPFRLAVSKDGDVYVTNRVTSCVRVFSWDGKYLRTFGATREDGDIEGITVDG